jgi:hypothetical protein
MSLKEKYVSQHQFIIQLLSNVDGVYVKLGHFVP